MLFVVFTLLDSPLQDRADALSFPCAT